MGRQGKGRVDRVGVGVGEVMVRVGRVRVGVTVKLVYLTVFIQNTIRI